MRDTEDEWQHLAREPFSVDEALLKIRAGNAPLKAVLKGQLMIKIQHGGRKAVQLTVQDLTFVRKNKQSKKWHISEEDQKRINKLRGV